MKPPDEFDEAPFETARLEKPAVLYHANSDAKQST
jgi:hypothetical protein